MSEIKIPDGLKIPSRFKAITRSDLIYIPYDRQASFYIKHCQQCVEYDNPESKRKGKIKCGSADYINIGLCFNSPGIDEKRMAVITPKYNPSYASPPWATHDNEDIIICRDFNQKLDGPDDLSDLFISGS